MSSLLVDVSHDASCDAFLSFRLKIESKLIVIDGDFWFKYLSVFEMTCRMTDFGEILAHEQKL